MHTASSIINKYITFFEHRGHKQITGASLIPLNDPTTLFTSSGMQPLIPYLLGESHPQGKRLVDVQNCFRAQDIDEIGDNRHTTFFRMLGNWSLGEYFKQEQLPWFFEFLTDEEKGLGLDPQKLHFTVFNGYKEFKKDEDTYTLLQKLLQEKTAMQNSNEHIHYYGVDKNWWSRAGNPDQMPAGEIGGPTSEVFYDFADHTIHASSPWKERPCHPNCDCGRYIEIGNSVFMTYKKETDGTFSALPQKNVDFGGGLERLLMATQQQSDVFQTNLFRPIIASIEKQTQKNYGEHAPAMRIIADHLTAAVYMSAEHIKPANKEQGYILRRLLRRGLDNFSFLHGKDVTSVLEAIVKQYAATDPSLVEAYEDIKNTILEETQKYERVRTEAKKFIQSWHDGEVKEISADEAFILYTTHGLSPTQIKSLGYTFNDQAFAQKMEDHQTLSRKGAEKKFRGGLADHQEKTIMGHTATHLLHQALRDVLGNQVHQTGSNITTERVRFDFNYDKKLSDEQLTHVEHIVNEKITQNLPVHFEILSIEQAKKLGAIGLFMDTYGEKVKIYFIGDYSIEFCGGPHVDFTGKLKSFKIIKQENLGATQKRLYAHVGI